MSSTLATTAEDQTLNEVSKSNKSNEGEDSMTRNGNVIQNNDDSATVVAKESPLKRAVKENENSIIQIILAPNASSKENKTKTTAAIGKASANEKTEKGGIEPLLDCLFEDGQLTRIEYDIVDKALGAESAAQQVQLLLRTITNESKGDEALKLLLNYLNKHDPHSAIVQKLSLGFLSEKKGQQQQYLRKNYTDLLREAIRATTDFPITSVINSSQTNYVDDVATARVPFRCKESNLNSRQTHDFYYGPNSPRMGIDQESPLQLSNRNKQQMINKTRNAPSSVTSVVVGNGNSTKELRSEDWKDFYLTNGCLETIRNLILNTGASSLESLTASGWKEVLSSMNGLLSSDVQSVTDLLFQLKSLEDQMELEDLREDKVKERNDLNVDAQNNNSNGSDDANLMDFHVNWNQIVYHSFQVWSQRNGPLATFYSLIGIFQHAKLFHTADLLLEHKREIQAQANEKGITFDAVAGRHDEIYQNNEDGVSGSRRASSTSTASTTPTLLEKSDFLRKFYSSRRLLGSSNKTVTSSCPPPLSATKERVSASPELSLDLL